MKLALAAVAIAVTLIPTAPALAQSSTQRNINEANQHHKNQSAARETQRQTDNRTVQRR